MSKTSATSLTASGENPAARPVVLRLVSDPATAMQLEKLRIALTRQISHYGWRLMMTALEAACDHGARHQPGNPQAVALWRWRAQTLRLLAMTEQPPKPEPAKKKGAK
jgi:hypothetical protein